MSGIFIKWKILSFNIIIADLAKFHKIQGEKLSLTFYYYLLTDDTTHEGL